MTKEEFMASITQEYELSGNGEHVCKFYAKGVQTGVSVETHGGPDGKYQFNHSTAPHELRNVCYTHDEDDRVVIAGLPG